MEKSQIYFHRAHRKTSASWKKFGLEFILFIPVCWLLVLTSYPFLTRIAGSCLIRWNSPLNPAFSESLVESLFFFGKIHTPGLVGKYPSAQLCFIVFIVGLSLILAVTKIRIPMPIAVWICFVSLIGVVSSLFFIFLPHLFPYTIQQFADIFIKTEIAVWLTLPMIMSFSLMPLPASIVSKFAAVVFSLFYAVAFGLVRYVLFVAILTQSSYLFMAVLFFCFGPFIDFISVVGVYSFYLSIISRKINQDLRVWNWSY